MVILHSDLNEKNTRFFLFTENMHFFDTRWKRRPVWSCPWQTWFIQIRWKNTRFFFIPALLDEKQLLFHDTQYTLHSCPMRKTSVFFFMPDIFHSVPVKKRLVSLILPTKKSASYGHAKLYEYVICTALCLAQCNDKGQETADKAATCSPSIVPPTEKNDCTYGGSESPWKAPWKPCAPMEVP